MAQVVLPAREFSGDKRKKFAKEGKAKSDGSFPIENEADVKKAIRAVGRAKDVDAARGHIIKKARARGLTKLLPNRWMAAVVPLGR